MSGEADKPRGRRGRKPLLRLEAQQRIKDLRHQGYSIREIADRLNDEGLPTPKSSAPWTKSHVYNVLGRSYMQDLPEFDDQPTDSPSAS